MKIYDTYGNLLLETEVSDRSGLYTSIDNRNQLTLHFSLDRLVDVPVGSWCNFEGNRYELMSAADVKMNHTENYEYAVVFSSYYSLASRYKVRNMVDGRLKFDLVAKPHEHLQMIVDNLNARDGGWSIGSCVESVEKLVSYNHTNCEEALVAIARVFETEIEAIGKVLSLKKVEYFKDSPLALSYGKGNGFRPGIQRTNVDDGLPVERLFVQGGSRNISLKEYGASELHLPKGLSFGFDGKLFEWEEGYDASNGRLFVTDDSGTSVMLSERSAGKEDSLDLSEVYPKREGEVTGVVFLFKGKEYDTPSSSWTEDDWNEVQIDIVDSTIPDSLDFNDCLLENNEPLTVVFQSGMLAGRELNANYLSDKKRFQLIKQEFDGQPMPQGAFSPKVGDSYGVFNVYLPDSYISDATTHSGAEYEALREASKYLYEKSVIEFSFTGEIDGMWAKKNWDYLRPRIRIGSYVSFTHDQMFPDKPALVRMVGITQYVNNPHYPKIELSNSVGVSTVSSRLNQIENNEAHVVELHEDAKRYTKRRYADIKQTIRMLSEALDNYTEGISPITVETMLAAVGDESLQYVFTRTIDTDDPASLEHSYNPEDGVFTVSEAFIKHMTLGIDSISPVHSEDEYLRWHVAGLASESLDKESGYYLYAKVSKESVQGVFVLSDHALKIDSEEGYYNLLVGILNAEFDGERSFASMYGFTEILPGQITTDNIRSSDGKTWFDLLKGILHLNDKAGVSGAIDVDKGDKSIAAWFGGLMEDLEFDDNPSNPANSLFRHDGSGYLAKGNIKFNEKGEVELSPNIKISGTGNETLDSILTMLAVFNDMFYFADENTIGTKYNFFSEQENSAGGVGEAIGTSGGGGDIDLTGYATEEWVQSQGYAKATDIPTKVSELENDAQYVSKSQADGTYVIWTDEFVPLKNKVDDIDERVTVLEATGGTGSGDIDLTAYATKTWVEEQGYVTSEAIDGKQDTIEDLAAIREGASKGATAAQPADIPTKVSQLTNDRNYITTTAADGKYAAYSDLAAYLKSTDIADWAKAATKPSYDYSEIGNAPDLSVYALASALNDYALKNDVYTQQQIAEILKSYVLTNDITELVEWYENIGVKFIKDADGAIKMDGDFYTTGENSAGGVGENVGTSGGGGLDESQLEDYLTENGYATQSWVTSQGYASSSSVDAKQDKITDLATIRAGAALGATALQGVPDGYVTETELDQKGYATTADLSGKVDKVTGKGLSTNDYTTAEKNKLASLENYDDTEVKKDIAANAEAIAEVSNRVIPLEEWYDLVGQHFKYDETNEAWYLDGDFYATGENSAGGAGDELIDIAGLDTRVETLETKVEELQKTSGQNLAIDFQGLDDLIQLSGSITPAELAAVGLTAAAIENMLNGQYNKIIHSGAKRQVWNYTAYEGDGVISIYLMQGDGFDIFNGYHLSYSSTTGYWSIVFGEI